MPNTPDQAIAFEQGTTANWKGLCLGLAEDAYGVLGPDSTASIAFARTKLRNRSTPIKGALLWWTGGSPTTNHPEGCGHVCIALDGVHCITNDFGPNGVWYGDGKVRICLIADIVAEDNPAHPLVYQGWSRDLEGVTVVPEPTPVFAFHRPDGQVYATYPTIDAAVAQFSGAFERDHYLLVTSKPETPMPPFPGAAVLGKPYKFFRPDGGLVNAYSGDPIGQAEAVFRRDGCVFLVYA